MGALRGTRVVFPTRGSAALETFTLDTPAAGEVLVETTRSLISPGTERVAYTGDFPPDGHWARWVRYPFAPGYSAVGRVSQVGDEVASLAVGDRVAMRRPHQSHVVARPSSLYKVPSGVPDDDAAWLGIIAIAAAGARKAHQEFGDRVAVVGLGPLGLVSLQLARLQAAECVLAVGGEERCELATAVGATAVVAGRAQQAVSAVLEATAGGADLVYDATGSPAALSSCLAMTRRFGKTVLLGDTAHSDEQAIGGDLLRRSLTLVGAHDSDPPDEPTAYQPWTRRRAHALALELLRRGDVRVAPLVTHIGTPADAPRFYDVLAQRSEPAVGMLLQWAEARDS